MKTTKITTQVGNKEITTGQILELEITTGQILELDYFEVIRALEKSGLIPKKAKVKRVTIYY